MELVVKKTAYKPFYLRKMTYLDFIVPLFGGFAVFFSDAFLFNPLIVAFLFLAFNVSWKNYLFTMLSMCVTGYVISLSYGVELSLISFTLLILSLGYARTSQLKNSLQPVIIINLFLATIMLLRSFSITNLGIVVLAGSASVVISSTFLSLYHCLFDQTNALKEYQVGIVMIVLSLIGMFNPVIGLIVFRIVFLFAKKIIKKEIGVIAGIIGALFLANGFNLQGDIVIVISIPLLLSYFISEKRYLLIYLLTHILLIAAFDFSFWENGLFYQGLVSALVCIIIPTKVVEKLKELFNKEENENLAILSQEEGRLKSRINELYNYLEVVTKSLDKPAIDSKSKAATRVMSRVCSRCDHFKYCQLHGDLRKFVSECLSAKNKKRFAKECLSPYKLALELTQAYNIFVGEANYYYEAQKRREQFVNSLRQIKKPINSLIQQMQKKATVKEQVIASLQNIDLPLITINVNDDFLRLITSTEIDSQIPLPILNTYLGTSFAFHNHDIDYFHNQHIYTYQPLPVHKAVFYTYSQAVDRQHPGDYFVVNKENNSISALLSDGMGHDENAYQASQFLGRVFKSLEKVNNNLPEILEELNSVLRFNSDYETYATFDYVQINLQELTAQFYKAGAFSSFIIKEQEIIEVSSAGLPLGIIDNPEYAQQQYLLQEKDIIVIVSDGIGEVLLNNKKLLSDYRDFKSLNEFGRYLFASLYSKMIHKDDATLIVLQIL